MTKNNKLQTKQAQYVAKLKTQQNPYQLAAGDAFIDSMKSVGYKHAGSQAAELIDNDIEAQASKMVIEILGERKNVVDELIFLDDGIGMPPEIIPAAMTWGGSDRLNSSDLFGRFGFGLPSACNCFGDDYSVISKQEDGDFYIVSFSVQKAKNGDYTDKNGTLSMPSAQNYKPSAKVKSLIEKHYGDFVSGTIIIIKTDANRLSHRSISGMKDHLIRFLGVTFYKFLDERKLVINDAEVQAIDPTFLTPSAKHYDIGGNKAESIGTQSYLLENPRTGKKGKLTVTLSYLGPKFTKVGLPADANPKKNNDRFPIMSDWNGFMIARNGRMIDVLTNITKSEWQNKPNGIKTVFQNYDRYYKVLLDFDAELDDMFSINTIKQTAKPSSEVWSVLYEKGYLFAQLSVLSAKFKKESQALKVAEENAAISGTGGETPAITAAKEASSFANPDPIVTSNLDEVGKQRLKNVAETQLVEKGIPIDDKTLSEQTSKIIADLQNEGFDVIYSNIPGGNFFDVELLGATLQISINRAHAFYKQLYMHHLSSPYMRQALQIVLFSIAGRVHRNKENTKFYTREIREWSNWLEDALVSLMSLPISDSDSSQAADDEEVDDIDTSDTASVSDEGTGTDQ